LETWYDWLAFVPRHQLGQIVPKIGDRKFGSIIQKFLHEYGEITIDYIQIVAPYEEDPDGPHPRLRVLQNNRPLRIKIAETQMPANIKKFNKFELRFATHIFPLYKFFDCKFGKLNSQMDHSLPYRHTDICGANVISANNLE
jgi:hypothetical protein